MKRVHSRCLIKCLNEVEMSLCCRTSLFASRYQFLFFIISLKHRPQFSLFHQVRIVLMEGIIGMIKITRQSAAWKETAAKI
ncbi:hypothetical protein L1987_02215 [Smallanthus sonchifolius]|uniref:Uncharacterized protein n=1 Tax=Smallanthus sonchifolius TaxID=185202 RepID=A0ACB9K7A7_9ASTR|nr:hypothetical protein L1987_02215 [Smallanthus sonchifolius]